MTKHKCWMQPEQTALDLVVSHQDQVCKLPQDAEVLTVSQFCPHYMILVGNNMLGIQGHPEFFRAYSAALTDTRRDRILPSRVREAFHSLNAEVDDLTVAQWMVNFIRQAQ